METIINLQIEIFLLIFLGYFLSKKGMLSLSTRKQLTSLVLSVILPAAIIKSFELDMSFEILIQCLSVLAASIAIQILYYAAMKLAWIRIPDPKVKVDLQYATMVSNAGFMGMPIAQAAFGPQGLLYASIFLIPQRVCMWSTGLALFTQGVSRKEMILKVATHPCIVALGIGVLVMFARFAGWNLPAAVDATISALAGGNTALSMIVIGSILADVPFSEMKDGLPWLYSLVRLVLLPAIVLVVCLAVGFHSLGMAVCVLETAMPAPSTVVMLAQNYEGDTRFASKLVFVSTLLSLCTLPLWLFVLQLFL